MRSAEGSSLYRAAWLLEAHSHAVFVENLCFCATWICNNKVSIFIQKLTVPIWIWQRWKVLCSPYSQSKIYHPKNKTKVFVSIICCKRTHSERGEKKRIAALLLHCNVVVNRRCCYHLHFHFKSINFQSKQWASRNSKRIECTRSLQKVRSLETVAVFGTNWWRSLSLRWRRDYSSHGFLLAELRVEFILCRPLQNWME